MIYIINGEEEYLIKKWLDDYFKAHKNYNISRFEGNIDWNIADILNACTSVDLFGNNSVVLVKDPFFLIKKSEDKSIKDLLAYCNDPLYECDLIFYSFDNKFNERLSVFKEISKNADHQKFNAYRKADFVNYCRSVLNKEKLVFSKDITDLLINSANNSIALFNANLEIIKLYPDKLDIDVISKLITYSDEEDVFLLINALTEKNISRSLFYLNKILTNDDNVLGLISLLAGQLRFLYEVSYYDSKNIDDEIIMDKINAKSSYRLQKARENLSRLRANEIMYLLSKLSELDQKCKQNNDLSPRMYFELFIISLMEKQI